MRIFPLPISFVFLREKTISSAVIRLGQWLLFYVAVGILGTVITSTVLVTLEYPGFLLVLLPPVILAIFFLVRIRIQNGRSGKMHTFLRNTVQRIETDQLRPIPLLRHMLLRPKIKWSLKRWLVPALLVGLSTIVSSVFSEIQWLIIGPPLALFFLIIQTDAKVLSQLFVKTNWIDITLIASVMYLAAGFGFAQEIPSQFSPESINFIIFGFVLGIMFRKYTRDSIYNTIKDNPNFGTMIATASIWTIMILLFSFSNNYASLPFYTVSIPMGMIIQGFASHRRNTRVAETIGSMSFADDVIITLGKYQKLKNGDNTKLSALINAIRFRLEGEYNNAINEIEGATEGRIVESIDTHLFVIKALSYRDMNEHAISNQTIDALLSSEFGRNNPRVYLAKALQVAEDVLDNVLKKNSSEDRAGVALGYAMKARELQLKMSRSKSESDWLPKMIDRVEPGASVLLQDVLGYSYLAAGYLGEARMLLSQCIDTDPSYSPLYLHLGDYFHLTAIQEPLIDYREELNRLKWHAELCYLIALKPKYPYGGSSSRAMQRLEMLK